MDNQNPYIIITEGDPIQFTNLLSNCYIQIPVDGTPVEKPLLNISDTGNIILNDLNTFIIPDQAATTQFQIVNQDIRFECPQCEIQFESNDDYQNHIIAHKTTDLWQCFLCKESFSTSQSYQDHLLNHSEEKEYTCSICRNGFNSENNFKIHMALHGSLKVCPLCNLSFQRKAGLKSHLATHQVEELHVCQKCGAEFETGVNLRKHMKVHIKEIENELQEFTCKYCKIKFDSKEVLKVHLSLHKQVNKVMPRGKRRKKDSNTKEHKHKCKVCDKTFLKLSLLQRHTKIHTGERPFMCYVCCKTFVQKVTLEMHLKKHMDLKPFSCTLCPAKFTQKYNLKIHVEKTHTATTDVDKLLKCPKCDCIFKRLASLNCHMTKSHSNNDGEVLVASVIDQLKNLGQMMAKPSAETSVPVVYPMKQKQNGTCKTYVCGFCDKETKKPSDLIRHLRTHTKEKPYECHCGKSFALKGTLQSHMQTHKMMLKHCTKCSYKSTSSKVLENHMKKHLSVNTEDIARRKNRLELSKPKDVLLKTKRLKLDAAWKPKNITKRYYKCQECSLTVLKSTNFRKHLQSHEADGKFFCLKCFELFDSKINLEEHSKSHDGETKSFECIVCEKKFQSKDLYDKHCDDHQKKSLAPETTEEIIQIDSLGTNENICYIQDVDLIDVSGADKNTDVRNLDYEFIIPELQDGIVTVKPITFDVGNAENASQTDITESFLADNVSLYPNKEIASTDNRTDTSYTVLVDDNIENLNIIHCLVCKTLFNDRTDYDSHVCLQSILKKNLEPPTTDENKTDDTKKSETKSKKQFTCVYCDKEFTRRSAYITHMNVHATETNDKTHKCKYCDKPFQKPSDLARHLRIHTGVKPFSCHVCDRKFTLKSTLEGHYRTHDRYATKDFVCEICNAYFSSKKSRRVHMLGHTGLKPFKCNYCDQQFKSSSSRKLHEQKHRNGETVNKRAKNRKITKILADAVEMAVTENTEHQIQLEDDSAIQISAELFEQLQNSGVLLQTIDPRLLQTIDEETEVVDKRETERNHECHICHKKYATSDVLRKHVEYHARNKFTCAHCSKAFPTVEALVEHEKLHSGYRPHSCQLCVNSFADVGHLKTHMKRIHNITDVTTVS